jgi:hypothetical protein
MKPAAPPRRAQRYRVVSSVVSLARPTSTIPVIRA